MRPESTRTTHCILLTTIVKHMRYYRKRTATHNNRPFPIIDKELNHFFFLFIFVPTGACFFAAAAMTIVSFDAATAVELVTVKLNCGCGNTREDTCSSHRMLKRQLHPAKATKGSQTIKQHTSCPKAATRFQTMETYLSTHNFSHSRNCLFLCCSCWSGYSCCSPSPHPPHQLLHRRNRGEFAHNHSKFHLAIDHQLRETIYLSGQHRS